MRTNRPAVVVHMSPSTGEDGADPSEDELLQNLTEETLDLGPVSRWPAEDRKFVPHPATWFNQERYLDDPKEWQRGAAAVPSQFTKTYQ